MYDTSGTRWCHIKIHLDVFVCNDKGLLKEEGSAGSVRRKLSGSRTKMPRTDKNGSAEKWQDKHEAHA